MDRNFLLHIKKHLGIGRHSVFGHVVEGMDIVNTITQDDLINSVTIIREGAAANAFDANNIFITAQAEIKKAKF